MFEWMSHFKKDSVRTLNRKDCITEEEFLKEQKAFIDQRISESKKKIKDVMTRRSCCLKRPGNEGHYVNKIDIISDKDSRYDKVGFHCKFCGSVDSYSFCPRVENENWLEPFLNEEGFE